jgi:hypothetical protein
MTFVALLGFAPSLCRLACATEPAKTNHSCCPEQTSANHKCSKDCCAAFLAAKRDVAEPAYVISPNLFPIAVFNIKLQNLPSDIRELPNVPDSFAIPPTAIGTLPVGSTAPPVTLA